MFVGDQPHIRREELSLHLGKIKLQPRPAERPCIRVISVCDKLQRREGAEPPMLAIGHNLGGIVIDHLEQHLDLVTTNGDLHRPGGHEPTIRTSLYDDDVVMFMVPYKEDFYKLGHHSSWFWEDHGLVTNV
jgi:hypothetical protein